jgi:hypothetical protein
MWLHLWQPSLWGTISWTLHIPCNISQGWTPKPITIVQLVFHVYKRMLKCFLLGSMHIKVDLYTLHYSMALMVYHEFLTAPGSIPASNNLLSLPNLHYIVLRIFRAQGNRKKMCQAGNLHSHWSPTSNTVLTDHPQALSSWMALDLSFEILWI